jgi:hypothetical protein
MQETLHKANLKDKQTDFSYWMTQSEKSRLEAIELLRQQYMNFKKAVQPRLQCVYRITNKAQNWIMPLRDVASNVSQTTNTLFLLFTRS